MKLLRCDGRRLEVRDVSEIIYELAAGVLPIKLHGTFLVADDVARDWLRQLIDAQKTPIPKPNHGGDDGLPID
jgi:hypothetical protein